MALRLNHSTISKIRNPAFRQYAENGLAVYDDFIRQVEQFGLPFAPEREEALSRSMTTLSVRWSSSDCPLRRSGKKRFRPRGRDYRGGA